MAKDFSNKNLQKVSFLNEDLSGSNFENTDLRGANFSGADLSGARFNNAKTGIVPHHVMVIFILSLLVSLLSGYVAMLAGHTVQLMLHSEDTKIRASGIVTVIVIGLFYSIIIALIMLFNPEAYRFSTYLNKETDLIITNFNEYIYYGFNAFTTVTYGDVMPRSSIAKSVSMAMGLSGQMYVALVIAMLIGKFAGTREVKRES